jgi:hypothetical protein
VSLQEHNIDYVQITEENLDDIWREIKGMLAGKKVAYCLAWTKEGDSVPTQVPRFRLDSFIRKNGIRREKNKWGHEKLLVIYTQEHDIDSHSTGSKITIYPDGTAYVAFDHVRQRVFLWKKNRSCEHSVFQVKPENQ